MVHTRKSDAAYWGVVVALLTLALIVVGSLWIMERRRAADLAEQLRRERQINKQNAEILGRLLTPPGDRTPGLPADMPPSDGVSP